jgi:hypothetical protein
MKAAALALVLVGAVAAPAVRAQGTPDRAKALRSAAEALGMIRWSDIGAANVRLPGIDIVNTQELIASGTTEMGGRMVKSDVHVALGYNPAAMRVEITPTPEGGGAQHTIETVRETWAWNESQIGAGLVAGKGTAMPVMTAVRERLLRLWTLPFGVVKAAYAAGDKAVVSTEGGATVITAPLSGPLAGMSVRATLDAKNLITKVEARSDNPALANLASEAQMNTPTTADPRRRADPTSKTPWSTSSANDAGPAPVFRLTVKTWETNDLTSRFPVPADCEERLPLRRRLALSALRPRLTLAQPVGNRLTPPRHDA